MGVQSDIDEPHAAAQKQCDLFKHNRNKLNSHVATSQHDWGSKVSNLSQPK